VNTRALIFLLLVVACVRTPAALAQLGPSDARIVAAGMPDPGYPEKVEEDRRILVTISVGPDGRATAVQLSIPSGDSNYDEHVRRMFLKMRVIPALDPSGTPVEGEVRFTVSLRKGSYPRNHSAGLPFDSTIRTDNTLHNPALTEDRLRTEISRIVHMRCRDFVWEYDFMKDIAGSRPIETEVMPRALLATYLVHAKTSDAQVAKVGSVFPAVLRASAGRCRDEPDAPFFTDSFAPAMNKRLQ
jgi:TonB family protein